MFVIAFVGKGGSGKSTVDIQLALRAAAESFHVLVLDLDRQSSMSQWAQLPGRPDNLTVERCRPDALEGRLRRARLRGMQLVLIDNPPELLPASAKIARAADLVIITTRPSLFDLTVTRSRVKWLKELGQNYAVVINAAPPTRRGIESPLVCDARASLHDMNARLWKGQITYRHAIIYGTAQGTGDFEFPQSVTDEIDGLWSAVVKEMTTRGKLLA